MSVNFWSDKETKIVKNYTASECIKHNLLSGRTACQIAQKRGSLSAEGITCSKKKYEPINSVAKDNTTKLHSSRFKFYTPEDDKIILENKSNQKAGELTGRTPNAIGVRRSYL